MSRLFLFEYFADVSGSNDRVLDAIEGRIAIDEKTLLVHAFRAAQQIQ